MPQASDASSYVFQGIWTNWAKGAVLGSTLTLSAQNAAVLFAILALFVRMTGSQLWTVIQFVLHQKRVSDIPMDALYHQQQVVLRNNTSDLNTMRQLLRLMWAWRRRSKQPVRRSIHLILSALVHFILFGLAGVFSSVLVRAGNDALSRSPYCGGGLLFKASYLNAVDAPSAIFHPIDLNLQDKSQDDAQLSQEYVQTCYNTTEPSTSCSSFPQQQLSWTTKTNTSCPFDDAVCHPSVSAISFDTGFLDSSKDLGLNAQESDRISYRRLTTCIPLNDKAYITSWRNITSDFTLTPNSSIEAVDAYYGLSDGGDRNATYSYENYRSYMADDQFDNANPYHLHREYALGGADYVNSGSFSPIPQLYQPNADVTLAFLSFDKFYEVPINDPWFSAHQKQTVFLTDSTLNETVYFRDLPVSTIGCTEQHQICTGGGTPDHCTALLGGNQIQTDTGGVLSLNLTARQNSTYVRVMAAALEAQMESYLSRLIQRDMPLLARRSVILLEGAALPDNQWQIETEYWHSIAMAHLQRMVIEYGTGQFAPDTSDIELATTPADKWLCQNLIVRGTSFQSFSILALTLLFVIGSLIVLFSLFIEDLTVSFRRRWGDMWKANDTLQIHRMLYQTQGFGTWQDGPNGVPVTDVGDKMKMLWVNDIPAQKGLLATQSVTQFSNSIL
jgi:hypothetical protein